MFERELNMSRNIYDIMAISYLHIIKDNGVNISNINYCDSLFNQVLTKYVEDKIADPCKAFTNLKEGLIALYKCVPFSVADYYNLLLEIDSHEIYNYRSSSFIDDDFITYTSLNITYKDKIRIFPVLLSNYVERLNKAYKEIYNFNYLRDRKSYDTLSINSKLNNYIIYSPNSSKDYNIIIHELTEYQDFTDHINSKKTLDIALFPITSINIHDMLDIKYTKDKQFNIDGINSKMETMIIERCKKFIESLDNKIDVLIFPEMLMTDSIINSLKETLIKKGITFTFCGSMWANKNNICTVLYEGDEIFQYYKKIPFDLKYDKDEFQKRIDNCTDDEQLMLLKSLFESHDFKDKIVFQESLKEEPNIHLIDINNWGRIITYICRDIDDDSYMNISKILRGDFIILPACSPSNDLISSAATLSERYQYTTVMCNTCSGLCKNENSLNSKIENKENIGFIVTPAKNNKARSHQNIFYTFNEKCKNCSLQCNGRVFTINMDELCLENALVSLDITETVR